MRRTILITLFFAFALSACGASRDTTLGKTLYDRNCAICHGSDARGGGGANVGGLSKTPPDLTTLSLQSAGDFPASDVIDALAGYASGSHAGRRMMPFTQLESRQSRRVRTKAGRKRVPVPQAAILSYLQTVQR